MPCVLSVSCGWGAGMLRFVVRLPSGADRLQASRSYLLFRRQGGSWKDGKLVETRETRKKNQRSCLVTLDAFYCQQHLPQQFEYMQSTSSSPNSHSASQTPSHLQRPPTSVLIPHTRCLGNRYPQLAWGNHYPRQPQTSLASAASCSSGLAFAASQAGERYYEKSL